MSKSWSFEVASIYTPYLDQLEALLGRSNAEFSLSSHEDDYGYYYRFTSSYLDGIDSPDDAYKIATQLVQLLNGILWLIYEEQPGKIRLVDLYEDRNRAIFQRTAVASNFQVTTFLGSIVDLNGWQIADLLQKSKINRAVLDLLYIVGEDITYHKLYMAYEAIAAIEGTSKRLEKAIGPELTKDLDDFTNTANNFYAIGTQARHRKDYQLPKTQVSIEQAEQLIKKLAHLMIEKHLSITLPFIEKVSFDAKDIFDDYKPND
jgi:hypothetical protein